MELEPVKGSENKAFKKQKVVTQMIRKKGFKKKEMVSSIEDSRGVSEVSSGLCNYQTVKLAKAVSVEWGKKKSGFTCRVKSKIERICQILPFVPSDLRSNPHHSPVCPKYKASSTFL